MDEHSTKLWILFQIPVGCKMKYKGCNKHWCLNGAGRGLEWRAILLTRVWEIAQKDYNEIKWKDGISGVLGILLHKGYSPTLKLWSRWNEVWREDKASIWTCSTFQGSKEITRYVGHIFLIRTRVSRKSIYNFRIWNSCLNRKRYLKILSPIWISPPKHFANGFAFSLLHKRNQILKKYWAAEIIYPELVVFIFCCNYFIVLSFYWNKWRGARAEDVIFWRFGRDYYPSFFIHFHITGISHLGRSNQHKLVSLCCHLHCFCTHLSP